MKRPGKTLLTAVLLLAALVPAGVYAALRLPHIAVTPSAPSVAVGEEFTVTVTNKEMRVCSYTSGITFDTNILEVLEIAQGDAPVYREAVCGLSSAAEANASGKIGLYAVHSEEAHFEAGTLLTIRFRAKAPGTALLTADEDCDGTEAFRAKAGRAEICISESREEKEFLTWRTVNTDCDLTLRQGGNTVWSQIEAPLGTYSVPVTPGAYTLEVAREGDYTRLYDINTASSTNIGSVCSLPWGDVNGSGETDAVDLQALYEYLSAGSIGGTLTAGQFAIVADCNGDSAINILDYQTLYEKMVTQEAVTVSAPVLYTAYADTTDEKTTDATSTNTATGTELYEEAKLQEGDEGA